jgi:hypothetical protein
MREAHAYPNLFGEAEIQEAGSWSSFDEVDAAAHSDLQVPILSR